MSPTTGTSITQNKSSSLPVSHDYRLTGSHADNVYNSYSGTDIVAEILLPNEPPVVLAELSTFSYSVHRENNPVRFLGRVNPAGFVKGVRLIAGSMVFTVFNYYAWYRYQSMQNALNRNLYPLADMMPPMDIVLTFANEFGSFSKMKVLGMTIVDEGGTMSVDDLVTESVYSYMARGIQPLTPISFNRESYKVAPRSTTRFS